MNLKTSYDNLKVSLNTKAVRIDSEIECIVYEVSDGMLSICFRNKGNLLNFPIKKLMGLCDELQGIYEVYGRG